MTTTTTVDDSEEEGDVFRAYSLKQVAERLSVSLKTVRRMVDAGEIVTFKPLATGRTVRVSERELRKLFGEE